MHLHSWLQHLTSGFRTPTYSRTARRRLCLCLSATSRTEMLESRIVLSAPDVDLSTLLPANGGNGLIGATLFGAESGDGSGSGSGSGSSVHHIGDVNGDGFDDLLVGARFGDAAGNAKNNAGESYVVFGKADWSAGPTLDLATVNGTNGFTLFGVDAGDQSGKAVSGSGDVNGDGYDDLLIGAAGGDGAGNAKSDAGDSYVVFGKADWSATPTLDLATLNGTNGFMLFGVGVNDSSGQAVSCAGDVNGDGFDDLLIGAFGGDAAGNTKGGAGESYMVLGKADWSTTPTLDLATLNGTNGFTLFGVDSRDQSGVAVSGAGDVNGDGFDDLLIGANRAYAAGNAKLYAGESYVVFGKADWSASPTLDLATLNGTNGFTLFGVDATDESGNAVSGAGDVNGDGFDDLLIGAPFADGAGNAKSAAGESYVVFGKADWSASSTLELATLNGANGFTLFGIDGSDLSGRAVSGAGDVNGDGFDDLLVGALFGDPTGSFTSDKGQSYLIFGKAEWSATPTLGLATLNGTNGFTLFGIDFRDYSGQAVSGAGDVNGDGFDDLLISSPAGDAAANAKPNAGESYVVFGGNFTDAVTHLGTANADTLTGTSSANVMNGGRGNDTLVGNGGADVLYGGPGDDILAVSSTTFARIDGANGADTLRLDGSGLTLNLTTFADNKLTSIETIDIRGSGANTLTLNQLEVLNLSGNSNTLLVPRDADDTVNIGTGWTQGTNQTIDGTIFEVLTQGAATLKVQIPPPSVTLAVAPASMAEAVGTSTVTATLSAVSGLDVTVDLAFTGTATNLSDYTRSGTQIVITVGNTTGTVTLTAVQDALDETNESVIVDIAGVTNGTESGTQQVTATITDDDAAPSVMLDVAPASMAEAVGTSTVTATLSAVSGLDVTVDLDFTGTATNVSDYTRSGTQIVISAGNTTGTVTLTAVQDALYETNESIIVDISGVTNGTESGAQQITATITDDDPRPSVTLGVAPASMAEAAGTSTVTATLSDVSGLDVTVDLAFTGTATNLSDYTRSGTQIVITVGNTTGTVTLTAVQDALDETNESVIVDIAGVTNGTESGTQQVTATITDDDAAPSVTLDVAPASMAEAAGTSTVTATLSAVSSLDVTVDLAFTGTATNVSDYTRSGMQIVIAAGNTTSAITLTSVQDALGEYTETIVVDISGVTNGTESGTQQTTATITDDDAPSLGPVITGPSAVTSAQRPVISWNSVPGATEYEIWVTKDPSTSPYHQVTVTQTSYTPPSDFGIGKFNLWVRAKNSVGVGPWTAKYTFVINTAATIHSINRSQPTLRPTISWNALPGAAKYDVWVNDVSRGITQHIRNMNVSGTSFTPSSDLPLSVYRAWVRGIAADGTGGAWSGGIEFVTMQAPTITQGQNPTFDRTPTFAWNALPGAATYEVFIRNRSTGATTISQTNITGLNFTPSTPLPDGPYRWWAIGVSSQGVRSFWTAPMDIYIGGRTDLLAPVGSTSDRTPTFSWRPVDGAVRYDLLVNQVGGQAQIIREQNLTGTSYTPLSLLPNGSYRAWIRAVSSTGEISPWSIPVDFSIAAITQINESVNPAGIPEVLLTVLSTEMHDSNLRSNIPASSGQIDVGEENSGEEPILSKARGESAQLSAEREVTQSEQFEGEFLVAAIYEFLEGTDY